MLSLSLVQKVWKYTNLVALGIVKTLLWFLVLFYSCVFMIVFIESYLEQPSSTTTTNIDSTDYTESFAESLAEFDQHMARAEGHLRVLKYLELELRDIPTRYSFVSDLVKAERSGNETYWMEVFDHVEPAVECVTFKLEKLTHESSIPDYADPDLTIAYLTDTLHNVFGTCGKHVW
jgi:hypothetical protein